MRSHVFLSLLLSSALMGCDGNESADGAFRESVAQRFDADCQAADAPTAELVRDLQRLCNCAGRKIRASDIALSDGQDRVSQKVGLVTQACTREIYGAAPADGNTAR